MKKVLFVLAFLLNLLPMITDTDFGTGYTTVMAQTMANEGMYDCDGFSTILPCDDVCVTRCDSCGESMPCKEYDGHMYVLHNSNLEPGKDEKDEDEEEPSSPGQTGGGQTIGGGGSTGGGQPGGNSNSSKYYQPPIGTKMCINNLRADYKGGQTHLYECVACSTADIASTISGASWDDVRGKIWEYALSCGITLDAGGLFPEDVYKALEHAGLDIVPISAGEVVCEIDYGHAVLGIITYDVVIPYTPQDHMVSIYGYNNNNYICTDPTKNGIQEYSKEIFRNGVNFYSYRGYNKK